MTATKSQNKNYNRENNIKKTVSHYNDYQDLRLNKVQHK